MGILKDVTEGIEPLSYQQALWDRLNQGGFKHGEIMLISAGRQTGKSMLNQYYNSMIINQMHSYQDITHATVDDHEWHTVKCNNKTAVWVRQQNKDMWYEHIDSNWTVYKNMFDIHERIYTMLQLKYGHDRV